MVVEEGVDPLVPVQRDGPGGLGLTVENAQLGQEGAGGLLVCSAHHEIDFPAMRRFPVPQPGGELEIGCTHVPRSPDLR